MTSILKGAVERGTAKKLKSLNVPLAGKTGTTNNNYDAWFIGFSSNLVIGVYIGFDNPKTLENLKPGQKPHYQYLKALLRTHFLKRIFRTSKFLKKFTLTSINYDTGLRASSDDKKTIIEAMKIGDINNINNNNLISVTEMIN